MPIDNYQYQPKPLPVKPNIVLDGFAGRSWDAQPPSDFSNLTTNEQTETDTFPEPPESGDYVLTAQDGILAWEEIEDCDP